MSAELNRIELMRMFEDGSYRDDPEKVTDLVQKHHAYMSAEINRIELMMMFEDGSYRDDPEKVTDLLSKHYADKPTTTKDELEHALLTEVLGHYFDHLENHHMRRIDAYMYWREVLGAPADNKPDTGAEESHPTAETADFEWIRGKLQKWPCLEQDGEKGNQEKMAK